MSNEYMVTVFNTVTARYEEIAVSKEIYNEYRRGEWRISKNNDKHSTGEIPFCALTGGEDGGYENFHEFVDTEHTVEAMLAKQEERRLARRALEALSPVMRRRFLLHHAEKRTAKEFPSTASKNRLSSPEKNSRLFGKSLIERPLEIWFLFLYKRERQAPFPLVL